MSLSSRVRNKLIDGINTAFNGIGYANGTKMPRSDNNAEPVAWELFIAQHLASLANKRKDVAEKAAAIAGVINDKEKDPAPAGTQAIVFTGSVISVSLEVKQSATRIDASKMADYLRDHGVKVELLNAAITHASTINKPAHVFKSMLVAENGQ